MAMMADRTGGIARQVRDAIGDETFEVAFYRANEGTLSDLDEVWQQRRSLSDLPETELEGWEELVVFTDERVYRWVETGYYSGPTVLPRTVEAFDAPTE